MNVDSRPVETEDGNGGSKTSRWDNKVDFFMASISSTIGLGNLWRFPYICYKNGGGAFLIPYALMIVIIGFPLVVMDLMLGQYSRKGPVGVWHLCPLFAGIGWSMLIMNFVCTSYYVMLMAYAIYYVAASFSTILPWSTCENYWNTANCADERTICINAAMSWVNGTCITEAFEGTDVYPETTYHSSFPSEEYFYNNVLNISNGITELGGFRWSLVLCLLLAWIFIVLGLSFGTRSWGKISYVTAILPYFVMLVLLIRSCMMPGAKLGILYFIVPAWSRLTDPRVWGDAAIQVFFSVGCGWGNFITIGKHNQFRDNPIIDAIVLVLGDFITSIFCGFVVFSVLGQMAYLINLSVNEVATSGPGLAFVVYPQAVLGLPVPQLWSVLFFLMLVSLGLGSAIPQMANILESLLDEFKILRSRLKRFLTLVVLCFACFLVGLIYSTNGGLYALVIVDTYGPSICLLVIGLTEVIAVSWVYGSGRLLKDLSFMTGWRPNHFFTIFWRGICPIAIFGVLVAQLVDWTPPCLNDYCFPIWVSIVGWLLTLGQLSAIPIYALTVGSKKGLWRCIRPTAEWGAEARKYFQDARMVDPTTQQPLTLTSKV